MPTQPRTDNPHPAPGGDQGSIFDLIAEPEAAPLSACCRQPLVDRRWGVWSCPTCGRAFTLPASAHTSEKPS